LNTRSIIYLLSLLIIISPLLNADSLWDDKAADIYSRRIYFAPGDSVEIIINESTFYQYQSESSTVKNFTVSIDGGDSTGTFEFIPSANGQENQTSRLKDEYKISQVVMGRILAVGQDGLQVSASKEVEINHRKMFLQVEGVVPLSLVDGGRVWFHQMIDPKMSLISMLEDNEQLLSDVDLIYKVLNSDTTGDAVTVTELSDQKKQKLLLDIFNKVLNIVF